MNGDSQKIYDAIVDNGKDIATLVERQTNQHESNSKDIKEIKEKMLSCHEKHETLSNHSGQLKGVWAFITIFFASLVGMWFKK